MPVHSIKTTKSSSKKSKKKKSKKKKRMGDSATSRPSVKTIPLNQL